MKPNPDKQRADQLLVALGRFESRARAQAAIEAGLVYADGELVRKASQALPITAEIVAEAPHPYVSRGGVKLAQALRHFHLSAKGKICLDIGSSTGGFCDVLLREGASRIHAIDSGRDQLHISLRSRPEIMLREGLDARKLDPKDVQEPVALTVIDVSFISLALVLPHVVSFSAADAELVALIKPQFEVGRGHIARGGIVKDEKLQEDVCTKISNLIERLGWSVLGIIPSIIAGGDGNREFLIAARRGK